MILTFSVAFPIASIVCLVLFFFKRSGQISRREEHDLDLICYGAIEGALKDFHPERQSSSH